jgi:hypothetical protein
LAGAKADGWSVSAPYVPLEQLRSLNNILTASAEEAGRDPERIVRLYNVMGLITPDSRDMFNGPGQHPRIMIRHDRSLLVVGQVDPHDRVPGRQQLPQPRQPRVAVAISPGQTATVTHGRPPRCAGISSPTTASGGRLHIQHRRA